MTKIKTREELLKDLATALAQSNVLEQEMKTREISAINIKKEFVKAFGWINPASMYREKRF